MKANCSATSTAPTSRGPRGVILLVMLGLLALFTLIAVTFVVATGQFRRGAAAAASFERMGDPFDALLHQALMQVARGSNNPQSAIGPHSLLEDMYGNGDAITGCCFIDGSTFAGAIPTSIYSNPSGPAPTLSTRTLRTQPYKGMSGVPQAPMLIEIGAVSFGWDREPGIALADDSGSGIISNGVVDDIGEVVDRADGTPTGGLLGDDCFLGSTYAHPAMTGEQSSDWPSIWNGRFSGTLPIIDNVENYYAGRVITFVTGDAAGQSSYIVRSKLIPITPNALTTVFRTVLYIQPFTNGAQPSHKDRFVINGRAFSGAGFGYSPRWINPQTGAFEKKPGFIAGIPNPALRALDMPYAEPFINTPAVDGSPYGFDAIRSSGYPLALLPNPVDSGYRDYLNRYNSIIDADEDYDAPDEQNMLLSYSVYIPSLNGSDPGRYRTIMPSLHRPDLVKYFTNQPGMAVASSGALPFPRWHDVPPYVRRRYILRPDPSDHYDWTQELNATQPQNSDGWTPGEPFQDVNNNGQWDPVTIVNGAAGPAEPYTDLPNPKPNKMYDIGDRAYYNTGFDAMDGPWDVDNDNDSLPDSIWVDLGAPVTTSPDGRIVKPMFAILVRDLDGRININAHGSVKHYDRLAGAYGTYNPTKPNPYQTLEVMRAGNYAYSRLQMEPSVAFNSTDVLRVHTAGEPDATRDNLSLRDIPFQGVWALPYLNDSPFFSVAPGPAGKATVYDPVVVNDGNNDNVPDSPWYLDGAVQKPVYLAYRGNRGGPRPLMFDFRGASNAAGTSLDGFRVLRGFEPAVGQGWSVADVNLTQVLMTGIWGIPVLPASNTNPTNGFITSSIYRQLLEGRPDAVGNRAPVVGRYGEGYLLKPSGFGGAYPGIDGPRAGATDPVLMFAHLLNEPATVLPPGASVPPQRGDDNYPAAQSRLRSPSNRPQYVRGNVLRDAFMPVPSRVVPNYGVVVPLPADPRYSPSAFNGLLHGDFGTPGDIDSDGSVALDVNGQPVFLKMGTANEEIDDPTEINLHRRYFAQTYFGVAPTLNSAGVPYRSDLDAPFTPAEMERFLRANDAGSDTLSNRVNSLVNDRAGNADFRRSITTESWDVPCPHVAPTPELAAAMRMLNLPINNPTIGDLLRARFYLTDGVSVNSLKAARLATIAMRSYRWQLSGDIAAIDKDVYKKSSPEFQAEFPDTYLRTQADPQTERADPVAWWQLQLARKRGQTRLLSSDLGQGLRMDINRPFGNGYDEDPNPNVGDGRFQPVNGPLKDASFIPPAVEHPGIDPNDVVDEPQEWVAGAVNPQHGSVFDAFNFDGNGDGNYSPNLDEEARQQFAKEIYCLMMLLIDQNYIEPLPTSVSAAATVSGSTYAPGAEQSITYTHSLPLPYTPLYPHLPNSQDKMRRWLTARRMAQWAINVVDFRDRDSIMTPFEFDADPFFDNDRDTTDLPSAAAANAALQTHLPLTNGTWDVDGYLLPQSMFPGTPIVGLDDTDKPWRGVVWGCEYPDLLLTETAAFHDRRTQNLRSVDGNTNGLNFATTNYLTSVPPPPPGPGVDPNDTNWDSRRIPQGTALFELYATGNPNNPALPRELYSLDPLSGELYLDLARTASKTVWVNSSGTPQRQTFIYPVWRLAVTESHYIGDQPITLVSATTTTDRMRMSIADRLREYPATCSLELRDPGMSVLPNTSFSGVGNQVVPVERVITFMQGATTPTLALATSGLNNSINDPSKIEVYSNITSTAFPCRVLPGDYVVVGPGRESAASGGPRNITCIGQTRTQMVTSTATLTNYSQPQSIIDMGDPEAGRLFLHTSVNGVDEYPIRQLSVVNPLGNLVRQTNGTNNVLEPTTSVSRPATSLQIRPPVSVPCMVAKTNETPIRRVGLNISEPLTTLSDYYLRPNVKTGDDWLPTLQALDAYDPVIDIPLDENTDGDSSEGPHNPNIPHSTDEREDRTLLNYKTVFLQRLADPTRGWDRYLNPYLTVDWMPIDLTVFNGESHYIYHNPPTSTAWSKDVTTVAHLKDPVQQTRVPVPAPAPASPVVPQPPYTSPLNPRDAIRFGSRQRGAPRTPFRGNYSYFDLWTQPDWLDTSPEFDTRPPLTYSVSDSDVRVEFSATAMATRDYYGVQLVRWQDPFDHTFGYLNLGYHAMRAPRKVGTTSFRSPDSLPLQVTPWIPSVAKQYDRVARPWQRVSPVREPLRRPRSDLAGLHSGWFTAADLGSSASYGNAPRYVGSPRRPFNWLTWNNRPFAGSMELMLVPASSPGRLLHEFSMRQTVPPAAPDESAPPNGSFTTNGAYANRYAPFTGRRSANHYMPPIPIPTGLVSSGHPNQNASMYAGTYMSGFISKPPFGHLLNFFESSNAPVGGSPTAGFTGQATAANYFRIFEFVTVPSRMSGARTPHYSTNFNNATGPAGTFEHPGWPFTAPLNLFSMYREPGKVNINTIIPLEPRSLGTENSTNANHTAQIVRNERVKDDGAGIWRSLVNDFFPQIRWFGNSQTDILDNPSGLTAFYGSSYSQSLKTMAHLRQQSTSTISGNRGTRAGFMLNPADVTYSPYPFNPSEDTVGNFYSAYASMFKDDPLSDPRGRNGVYENYQYWNAKTGVIFSDDNLMHPFWNGASPAVPAQSRHDGTRPAMFSKPFRSFMEDFSATPQGQPIELNLNSNNRRSGTPPYLPLLAVDATLLRRKDTSWNPWHPNWLPSNVTATDLAPTAAGTAPTITTPLSKLFNPAQIDPRFDPLFALNYPRPFRHMTTNLPNLFDSVVPNAATGASRPAWWTYSGYTSSLAHYVTATATNVSTTQTYNYGTNATAVDAIHVKDSDYRNTDRNPFFRYQLYTKLSNTVTTRSNVYAIWVTVGYFECERVQPQTIYPVQFGHSSKNEFQSKHRYPDGFRILRELGSDNGETQRHRAFAILDRTIPVGFLRGENLNVDRCFLIKRIVE